MKCDYRHYPRYSLFIILSLGSTLQTDGIHFSEWDKYVRKIRGHDIRLRGPSIKIKLIKNLLSILCSEHERWGVFFNDPNRTILNWIYRTKKCNLYVILCKKKIYTPLPFCLCCIRYTRQIKHQQIKLLLPFPINGRWLCTRVRLCMYPQASRCNRLMLYIYWVGTKQILQTIYGKVIEYGDGIFNRW